MNVDCRDTRRPTVGCFPPLLTAGIVVLAIAGAIVGCAHDVDSADRWPTSPATSSEAMVRLDLTPLALNRSLEAIRISGPVDYGSTGKKAHWQFWIPTTALLRELRIQPFGAHRRVFALRLGPGDLLAVGSLRLPLLERRHLTADVSADRLDLLQLFQRPLRGSRITRFADLPIRVALPDLPDDNPYVEECRHAIDSWNVWLNGVARPSTRATSGPTRWLQAVAAADSAAVRCTVFEETELGFTRILARDAEGLPTSLRVHLSPRFHSQYPRYIRRAWSHELGHVFGLWGHSQDLRYLMNGRAVIVDTPHADELEVLHLLYRLPLGFDLRWIQRGWKPPKNSVPRYDDALLSAPTPR